MPRIHKPADGVVHRFDAQVAIAKGQAVIWGTAEDDVTLPAAANDTPVGIALNDAAIGEEVDVCMFGPCDGIAGGAITRGAVLGIGGANGRVVAVTPGVTTADTHIIGTALETVGADGNSVSLFVGLNQAGAR
jgi:hypothetical protein